VPTEAKAIVGLVLGQGPRGKKELVNKNDDIDSGLLSERVRLGSLKGVYHGAASVLALKELVRSYGNLVEDATRVMQRNDRGSACRDSSEGRLCERRPSPRP